MQEIFMVMDCDHMCKPEVFNKMGPCMIDEQVGVVLVPQHYHNQLYPDTFDSANMDFMVTKMPYGFGAGQCLITGVYQNWTRAGASRFDRNNLLHKNLLQWIIHPL
jgi:hypothetical protein